jgi:5-methylcytosine-specific restriction endonuclease McrA
MTETKKCCVCDEARPRDLFTKDKSRKDGLRDFCRDCAAKKRGTYEKRIEREALTARGLKRCTRCKEAKPIAEFRDQLTRSGSVIKNSWCTACMRWATARSHERGMEDPLYREKIHDKNKRRYHEVLKNDPAEQEKKRVRMQAYQARPEVKAKMLERGRQWVVDNPERVAANQAAWREANPEKSREYGRAYRGRHRERYLDNHIATQHVRRWRMYNQGEGRFTALHVIIARAFWNDRCAYCGSEVQSRGRGAMASGFDHVVPLSKGGGHGPGNLVLCCKTCNDKKGPRLLPEEALVAMSTQLELFVVALPSESFWGATGTTPMAIRQPCFGAAQKLRGLGVPIGTWW